MPKSKKSLVPIVGLVLATVLWGSSFIAMKFALQTYGPLLVVFGRMSIASLIFVIFWKKVFVFTYRKGDWKYLGLMALCEPCLYFLFESYALKYTTASQAGMITALLPISVAIAATFLLKETTKPTTFLGFSLAIIGIVVMTGYSVATKTAPRPILGNVLQGCAMICATGYTLLARYLGSRYSALFLTATQMAIGTLFFSPALFLFSSQIPFGWALGPSLAIVYLGGGVSVFAYSLYNYGLSEIPASQASSYINLIPVFAVLFGWLILQERFAIGQGVGMSLVLIGIWLSSVDMKSAERQEIPCVRPGLSK